MGSYCMNELLYSGLFYQGCLKIPTSCRRVEHMQVQFVLNQYHQNSAEAPASIPARGGLKSLYFQLLQAGKRTYHPE